MRTEVRSPNAVRTETIETFLVEFRNSGIVDERICFLAIILWHDCIEIAQLIWRDISVYRCRGHTVDGLLHLFPTTLESGRKVEGLNAPGI